ncbi:MAG: Voltage-gated potassium channel [Candidatus Thorarchaeota archaeon]|nr:MAG: Voltage-gated potassium channel [Candidatus Thorarchaeota archaeon]
MRYRKVGKSGLKISEISLGSWLTYGGTVDDKIAKNCMRTAIEQGINFIDSAEVYAKGQAEKVIGEWLKEETVERKKLVLSSKVFWPTSDAITDWGNTRKNIMNAIQGTLERLGTDHIDIYYLHRYDYTTPLKETVEVLDDLIRAGKIHYWGTSVWTAAQLERANAVAKALNLRPPIVEQPMYNMFFRHIEYEIMPVAKTHGMGFTVWSPLYQGLLTGKYNDGIPEGSRGSRSESLKEKLTEENLEKLRRLGELADSLDISMSQMALAWILRRPEISAAITGATKPEHVIENAQASDITLSSTTLEEIEDIMDNEPEWPETYGPNIYHKDKMR